jgi:hypothetical protein
MVDGPSGGNSRIEPTSSFFYSGLNALGLLTVITELAAKLPEVWELQFDSAERQLVRRRPIEDILADRLPMLLIDHNDVHGRMVNFGDG